MKTLLLTCSILLAAMTSRAVLPANVIVNPGRTYSDVRVSTAYNGTIYLSRLGVPAGSTSGYKNLWELLKSTDGGATWQRIVQDSLPPTREFRAADICAAGGSSATFKLFAATSAKMNASGDSAILSLRTIDPATGATISTPLREVYVCQTTTRRGYEGIALASDWRVPASGASPYTFSMAVIKAGASDSIISFTDASGGAVLHRTTVYGAARSIRTISAAVGSIHKRFNGLLGITWDEFVSTTVPAQYGFLKIALLNANDGLLTGGHNGVYTSESETGLPDSRRPVIAISQTNVAQDTGIGGYDFRITSAWEVGGNGTDIRYRSRDSFITGTTPTFNFYIGGASPDTASTMYPCVIYDPSGSRFLFSWYNALTQNMPLRSQGLHTPPLTILTTISANYRTATTPMTNAVNPRLSVPPGAAEAYAAWNDAGNTVFMSVASPTAIHELSAADKAELIVYPNPADAQTEISFFAEQAGITQIQLTDVTGRALLVQSFSVLAGKQHLPVSLGNIPSGIYLLRLSGAVTAAARLQVYK